MFVLKQIKIAEAHSAGHTDSRKSGSMSDGNVVPANTPGATLAIPTAIVAVRPPHGRRSATTTSTRTVNWGAADQAMPRAPAEPLPQ